jgi:hypothetical protein
VAGDGRGLASFSLDFIADSLQEEDDLDYFFSPSLPASPRSLPPASLPHLPSPSPPPHWRRSRLDGSGRTLSSPFAESNLFLTNALQSGPLAPRLSRSSMATLICSPSPDDDMSATSPDVSISDRHRSHASTSEKYSSQSPNLESSPPPAAPFRCLSLSEDIETLESALDSSDDLEKKVDILMEIKSQLTEAVISRDDAIEDLEHEHSYYELRLTAMREDLEQYQNAHAESQYRLDKEIETRDGDALSEVNELEADNEIEDLTHEVAQKDKLLANALLELKTLKKTLATLTKSIERKDLAAEKKDREIADKDETIAIKGRKGAKKNRQLAVMSGQLLEKSAQIDALRAELDGKDAILKERIAEKDTIIDEQEFLIEDQHQDLAAHDDLLADKAVEIEQLRRDVYHFIEAIEHLEGDLEEKSEEVTAATEQLEEMDEEATEEMEEKDHELMMKECIITDLEHKLLAKDDIIKKQDSKIDLRERRIQKRDDTIATQDIASKKSAKSLKKNTRLVMNLSRRLDGALADASRAKLKLRACKSMYEDRLRDAEHAKGIAERAMTIAKRQWAKLEARHRKDQSKMNRVRQLMSDDMDKEVTGVDVAASPEASDGENDTTLVGDELCSLRSSPALLSESDDEGQPCRKSRYDSHFPDSEDAEPETNKNGKRPGPSTSAGPAKRTALRRAFRITSPTGEGEIASRYMSSSTRGSSYVTETDSGDSTRDDFDSDAGEFSNDGLLSDEYSGETEFSDSDSDGASTRWGTDDEFDSDFHRVLPLLGDNPGDNPFFGYT